MTGRAWAYIGALLGGIVSVAANVAHSYVPPADAGPGWHPHAGAVVGAVFWPVALFVAIEILARVVWPAGRWWTVLRLGGLIPVALVAAVVSYRHLAGLLVWYREDGLTAVVGPLAVDGLMVMATAALVATGRGRQTTEVAPVVLPPAEPVSAQVTADLEPAVLPPLDEAPKAEVIAEATAVRKPRKTATTSAPKRPFAVTQRAAAALQADGMDVPGIAAALGITQRQARAALKPVAVEATSDEGR